MRLYKRRAHRRGQSLAEYGFLIALVGLFALLAVQALGTEDAKMYNHVSNDIHDVNTGIIPAP